MELFIKLFGNLLLFVYHCFDRIVIHGYLSGLSRAEQVVYFFRQVVGVAAVDKEVLRKRTDDYQSWVEAYAHNHHTAIEWAAKGVRKEDYVLRRLHAMQRAGRFGVYFIFRSMDYPSIRPRTRTTASSRLPAPATRITTSTFATRGSGRW